MGRRIFDMKLFPTDLGELEWLEFAAEGFSQPVSGLIYNSQPAVCGMPLGSIDTGCIDLETNGTLGFCTIFNSHVPRRGPLNLPFLGLSIGSESWILSTHKIQGYPSSAPGTIKLRKAESAKKIHYWGHYPVADIEYDIDAPISVGLRAWAPFVPGDLAVSNTPGIIFEVHLRNITDSDQNGTLSFSFPGPSPQESFLTFRHEKIDGSISGVSVANDKGVGYFLGVIEESCSRTGGDMGVDGGSWSRIMNELPSEAGQAGASVCTSA